MVVKTAKDSVKVLKDPQAIRVFADPVRREILRQLTDKSQTQSHLAEKLKVTSSSISHHLHALLDADLIRVQRTKIGPHGILEKYYEPTHRLFIEDFDKIPEEFKKYFLHSQIERLRGILSILELLEEKRNRTIEISPSQLKELAQEIARSMAHVAGRYERKEMKLDREELLIKVYSETLKEVMRESKWQVLFSVIS